MSQIRIAEIRSTHFDRQMKWNRSEVNLLCKMEKITHGEMVAYIGWDLSQFKRCYKVNRFPAHICLLLEIFQAKAKLRELGESPDFDLPFPNETT